MDPTLYDYLPDDFYKIRDILFKEFGYSYWYINYLHKDTNFGKQKERIHNMIKDFTDNYDNNIGNIMWIKEKISISE